MVFATYPALRHPYPERVRREVLFQDLIPGLVRWLPVAWGVMAEALSESGFLTA